VTASFREGASSSLLALLREARENQQWVEESVRAPLAAALAQ